MKLAVVTPVLLPYRGGMGTVALENARMAADAMIHTTLYTPYYGNIRRSAPAVEERGGCTIVRLRPLFSYGNAALLLQLFWRLKDADIIHLHYPALGLELPVIFWGLLGKKVFVTYHMDLVGRSPLFCLIFGVYNRTFLPMILRVSTTILVTSLDYAQHSSIIKKFFRTYKKKIIELPNSVDTRRFTPSKSLGAGDTPSILFIGTMDKAHYSKGVDILLHAWAGVMENKTFENGALTLVGDGDMRHHYEVLAGQLGVGGSVDFVGAVSDDALPVIIRRSTCVVLPSTHATEAFGVVLLEAGASGVPVIATNLPGVRSVIQEGETGYLVPPGDAGALTLALVHILEDLPHAQTLGCANLERVRMQYSYDIVAKQFIQTLFDT